jgi:two-component system response regulator YesN
MYSVLLVDDEKIIREGVYELLSMAELDLDLTMAASAVEALSILEARKIDIVLIDICMPQMSGLELYDVICEKWPHSKMIFLTGHLEFDYVYKVHKHARYVLKAEEDEKIVEAVRESIEEIENDFLLERITMDHSMHQHRNKYYERMLLLRELVEGSISSSLVTQEMMDQLGVDLDLREELYCIMIRCAGIRQLTFDRQSFAGGSLCRLIEKIYLENWKGTYLGYNKSLSFLLLQPKSPMPVENALGQLEGYSEMLQKAVTKNLNLPVSIYIMYHPVMLRQAISNFSIIRDRMVGMTEDEIRVGPADEEVCANGNAMPESLQWELSRKVQQLDHKFDSMDRNGILSVISELQDATKQVASMTNLLVLELYCSVSAKVIGFAKKLEFSEDAVLRAGIGSLYDISRYGTWIEAFQTLGSVTEHIFDHVDISMENKTEDVINRTKTYIKDHLDGDTSLYALSCHVHLCPEHLLRIFKRSEGITILQYINDLKLTKARQLLTETDMQIKDIATALGFTSAGYFGRFFKGKLGVTPNVYREQKGKMK